LRFGFDYDLPIGSVIWNFAGDMWPLPEKWLSRDLAGSLGRKNALAVDLLLWAVAIPGKAPPASRSGMPSPPRYRAFSQT
jgi:hypothetical protein